MERDGTKQDKARLAWMPALCASTRRAAAGPRGAGPIIRGASPPSARRVAPAQERWCRPVRDQARIGASAVVAVGVLRRGLAGAADVPPAQRARRLPNMSDPDGARG